MARRNRHRESANASKPHEATLAQRRAQRDSCIEQYYTEHPDRANALLEEYYDCLPRMTLSRCPFTRQPLTRVFDPWGIDGFWWQDRNIRRVKEPTAPRTFHLLQGAVSFNGQPLRGGIDEAFIGPDVPFVIPRIMSRPGMVAVVSSITMANGYIAYPIAYYSLEKQLRGSMTQSWREETYSYDGLWRIDAHPWDFELKEWVESGRVKWIAPDDPEFVVQEGWGNCPYQDLPGHRQRQTLTKYNLFLSPPPNDEEFEPFE